MSVYLTDFLHKQRGMTVERGTLVGFVFGLGSVLGQLGGAKIGQNLYNRRAALQPVLMGVGSSRAPYVPGIRLHFLSLFLKLILILRGICKNEAYT